MCVCEMGEKPAKEGQQQRFAKSGLGIVWTVTIRPQWRQKWPLKTVNMRKKRNGQDTDIGLDEQKRVQNGDHHSLAIAN